MEAIKRRFGGRLALACLWLLTPALAHADDAPSALVIAAETEPGSPLSEASDAVRASLEKLVAVKLLPPAPLDLDAVQLAINCPDTSARCLREIATRMEAQIVIVPSIKKRKDALELRITGFNRDSQKAPTTVLRKHAGTSIDATLLAAVPGMVREALELGPDAEERAPEPEPTEPEAVPEPAPIDEPRTDPMPVSDPPQSASRGFPLGPVLVGGGGVVLLAAGIVVGAMANGTEDDYASHAINTAEQAEAAEALRVQGEDQALAANILLGTGAAALVAAGIWYVLDGPTEHARLHARLHAPLHATLRPVLGPSAAGLVLAGHWEQLP